MPRYAISVLAAVVVGGLASASSAFALPHSSANGLSHRPVCAGVPADFARCDSQLVTTSTGRPFDGKPQTASVPPAGYGPDNLQSAYSLSAYSLSAYSLSAKTGGSGQTVAIVDAYNDPNAAKDLAVYRSQFGLPAVNNICSVSKGKLVTPPGGPCFVKVNQSGGTGSFPRNNASWAQEISLDLDMVSAICPNCNIVLVEANSNSNSDLYSAENAAATLGATEISNSWSGGEYSGETSDSSKYFNHSGIAITAASGDSGYAAGTQFPAASQYVTAVGGTTLKASGTTRGWTESAWSGAGSGCSAYEPQPLWQAPDIAVCGTKRAVADVSADADPNTGVSVYDSYSFQGMSGWLVFGGTSVGSPIVASIYALAGNASSTIDGSYPYQNAGSLNDVTSGSNGSCGSPLCTAGNGWDGPTGLGTPNGIGAF
jgi:subtilase family serine protease